MNAQTKKLILGLLGPLIAAGSAWLAAAVAKYGVHLPATGIDAFGTAGVLAAAGFVLKLIHDIEKPAPATGSATVEPAPVVPTPDPATPDPATPDPASPAGWPADPPAAAAAPPAA